LQEKSTRKFIGIFTILLLVFVPFSVLSHQAHAASSTGVMVALYTYPDSTWTTVAQAKAAHPSVPVVAVINPNNGPGSSRDSNYVNGIQKLHSAGVVVLGYDATGYATRSASTVKTEMNTWKSLYNIDGIFFDEMSNVAGHETYYSNLSSYAKSLGYTMTVGNPGTDTLSSYIGTVDNLMIYENPGLPSISALEGWHTNYAKSNFSMIAFGISSLSQSFITSASNYVGYIYITNDVLPNPYDSVPSYFGNEVAYLDTGSSTSTAPQSPTNLSAAAVSQSQINISWNAPANNGGSPILGYKVQRSLDGGSTWNTIVSNTGSTASIYSNTGLASNTAYTYRVSAINAIGTSSPSNTVTAKTGSITTQVSLTVKSVDLSGNTITGLWTTISSGQTIKTGYTTMTITVTPGTQYTVTVANYQNYVFDHWANGSTNPTRTITPTQDTTIVAYYQK